LFLLSGVLLAVALFFINTSYLEFTNAIIVIYNLQEKADIIKSTYLTNSKYEIIKYIMISVSLIVPLVSFYMYLHLEVFYFSAKQFINFLVGLYQKLKAEITSLSKKERYIAIVAFILLTVTRVYFAYSYPVHIDEAFSYVFIVSKGWLATLTYYPGPNNHIAYLLLCAPFNFLFDEPQLIMRAPALLVSTFTSVACFLILKKYFGFIVSFSSVLLFSFSEYGIYYAVHGRGYFLMLFFFSISLVCLMRSITLGSRYYFILFCLGSALGLYTIPIFAYPLASMLLVGFLYAYTEKNTRKIRWIFISSLIIFLLTTLLYLPIILTNGYEALIGNRWVKPLSSADFYNNIMFYLADTPGTFYSLDIYGIWITLLNLIFWFRVIITPNQFIGINPKLNLQYTGWFIIGFYVTPICMLLLQQVIPGTRTWLYLSLIEYVSIVLAVKIIINKWSGEHVLDTLNPKFSLSFVSRGFIGNISPSNKIPLMLYIIAFYTICMCFYIQQYTLYREPIYKSHPLITEKIVQEKPKKVLVTQDLYNVFLRYEALKANQHILIDTKQNNNRLLYDYVILKKSESFPEWLNNEKYTPYQQDGFVNVLIRKKLLKE
jgi:hypothetical protein